MCLEEVGRVAAQCLLAAIAGQQEHHAPTVHTVPTRLVVRESSGGYSPQVGG
jgi:DNA-binding LacI/PurR family transcriptional regulator